MTDRRYSGFYERARQSDTVSVAQMSSEEVVKRFQDKVDEGDRGYRRLSREVAERQKEEDLIDFEARNVVQTENRADIPERAVFRPTDRDESYVRTTSGNISIDRVTGTFEKPDGTYVMVDNKIYGKLED